VADAHLWRQRGGNSHKAGAYSRAHTEYSKGIAALQGCTGQEELLAVLYNNRAAAALMLQQAHAALEDALMAQQLNSSYLGAYLRLASCHQRLGDLPAALAVLGAAQQLPGVNPQSPDGQKVAAKLAEAQQLQQQLVEVQQWVAGRGLKGSAASSRGSEVVPREQQGQQLLDVMESLVTAMPSCGEVKVLRALLLLCTGQLAAAAAAAGQVTPQKGPPAGSTPGKPVHAAGDTGTGSIAGHARSAWQQWIKAQGEYHKGELVKAQHLLQDLVNHTGSSKPAPAAAKPTAASTSSSSRSGASSKGSSAAQLLTELAPDAAALQAQLQQLQQLLAKKDAGNAAVQRKAVDEAVQQYTEALQLAPPAPFAAVLYCNRAAAYHSKSPPQWTDALADCGRALALNPGYAKAHSR
jgi:tetratricopeptide (TPR) repeat protein